MQAIENWKSALAAEKAAEITVGEYTTFGEMIRIDLEHIPEFVPRHSGRQHGREDATIARVCVCDSLMGCIAGYASFFHDFDVATTDGKWLLSGVRFKGGMYIHQMPYEYLAVPSDRLAGDSSISGEKWLVPYDEAHASFKSVLIGKVFIGSVTSRRFDRASVVNIYSIYLEIGEGHVLKLTPTRTLTAGYWKLTQTVRSVAGRVKITQEPVALEQAQISSHEYLAAKQMGVEMLSEKIKAASLWR
jgi:hypothetical protein